MYTNASKQAKKIKIMFEDMISGLEIFGLKFFIWTTIIEVKKELEKYIKTTHNNMRLFYKNLELNKNGRRLLDYHVKSRQIITVKMTPQLQNSLGVLNPYQIFENSPKEIEEMLDNVKNGFLKGIKPKLTENGTSGSYFLENHARRSVAIFKPFDQEPYAPNNPRNFVGQLGSPGFRKGILSGESATREVAAFLLNNEYHGVPATTYIQFYHPSFQQREHLEELKINSQTKYQIGSTNISKTKHGSLQTFVSNDDVIGNFGSNIFSVEEIHKIAILDLRILNCDRNEENILVKKGTTLVQTSTGTKSKKDYKLTPIDHGLSFPDTFQIYDYELIWMDYNQSRQPFTEKELKFIQAINPQQDCKMLREKLGFREICLRNFRIAQTLLKKAAKMGYTLNQIGHMLYRREIESEDEDKQMKIKKDLHLSEIERLVQEAQNIYFIVKQNGIKSTVEYQIGLIKNRNRASLMQKIPILGEIKEKEKEDSEDQSPRYPKKFVHQYSAIQNNEKENKRSVSLPSLKKDEEKSKEEKPKHQKQKLSKFDRKNQERQHADENWEEIFYHYFEDILDRYLKEKRKKLIKRERSRSQYIDE